MRPETGGAPWHEGIPGPEALDADACRTLIARVYLDAVTEWRALVRALGKRPDDRGKQASRAACERFIAAGWCAQALGLKGRAILDRLGREERR